MKTKRRKIRDLLKLQQKRLKELQNLPVVDGGSEEDHEEDDRFGEQRRQYLAKGAKK